MTAVEDPNIVLPGRFSLSWKSPNRALVLLCEGSRGRQSLGKSMKTEIPALVLQAGEGYQALGQFTHSSAISPYWCWMAHELAVPLDLPGTLLDLLQVLGQVCVQLHGKGYQLFLQVTCSIETWDDEAQTYSIVYWCKSQFVQALKCFAFQLEVGCSTLTSGFRGNNIHRLTSTACMNSSTSSHNHIKSKPYNKTAQSTLFITDF